MTGSTGSTGFTLLELMIALVVLGILSAVAFPSFMDSIRKSRRSDATQALNAVQQAQERRRANSAAYTNDIVGAAPGGLAMPSADSPAGFYALSAASASGTGYRLVATARGGTSQASDGECVVLVIEMNAGNISYLAGTTSSAVSAATGTRCWKRQ